MQQIHKTITPSDDLYIKQYFSKDCAFFDIETTGFSPKNSFVYLIGLALWKDEQIHVYQFLAENQTEEGRILVAFYQKLASVKTLITFNGLGFDIPFLKGRELSHRLNGNWDSFSYIDLYKHTAKLSHLFHLPNKKQKSLEQFLGINREDIYTGGELISIYYKYEKTQDSELESLLFLHNFEDVLGMTKLLPLLAYRDFFEQPVHVLSSHMASCRPYGATTDEQELLLDLKVLTAFPKPLFYHGDFCNLMCQDASAKLQVKIYSGELKFYYENYKDYYYLPDEDMAIHKSVAAFVDASHRKKATAATCYTRKNGLFLPQNEIIFTPYFYPDKKGGISYFELRPEFLSDGDALDAYGNCVVRSLL